METVLCGDWMSWCRLCAVSIGNNIYITEPVPGDSSLPNTDLATAIADFLQTQVKYDEILPQQVCAKCHQELIASLKFRNRAIKVQQMYDCLINCYYQGKVNLKMLFEKFGLFENASFYENQSIDELHVPDLPLDQKPTMQMTDESVMIELHDAVPLSGNETCNNFIAAQENKKCSSRPINAFESNSRCHSKNIKRTTGRRKKRIPKIQKNQAQVSNYSCNTCSKHFKRIQNFYGHMKKVHGEDTTVQTKALPESCLKNESKWFICKHCDKKLESKEILTEHLKSNHEDILKQTFVCEICGEIFSARGQLKEHMLMHTDVTPFECKTCGMGFKMANRLKRHMEIHEGKHNCKICGKQLNSRTTLNSHLLVHSNSMPHKCDYCGRAFKRVKTLKVHLIAHTGIRPFICNFCDKTFSSGSSCRSHKKQVHPKELSAMDEEGKKSYTKNLPKLGELKAVVKKGENLKPLRRWN
ncbi:zinc finger protein weckle-like [Eurosta solidaginis]|uniref:zinc finger protein weckle-like n=1 Tax=Eurosta solidaginis TaxID=178769 RepID=UPI003530F7CD